MSLPPPDSSPEIRLGFHLCLVVRCLSWFSSPPVFPFVPLTRLSPRIFRPPQPQPFVACLGLSPPILLLLSLFAFLSQSVSLSVYLPQTVPQSVSVCLCLSLSACCLRLLSPSVSPPFVSVCLGGRRRSVCRPFCCDVLSVS